MRCGFPGQGRQHTAVAKRREQRATAAVAIVLSLSLKALESNAQKLTPVVQFPG